MAEKDRVASITRALDILECFMDFDTEWTLKELVHRLELPSTTVFRQLATLVEREYLIQDPVRKSYQIGPRLLLLSSAVIGKFDLRTIARPEIERLSEQVHETINLSAMIDHDIFYLDKVEPLQSVACNTKVGSRVPAHATSAGKAMMAYKSPAYIDAYCAALCDMPVLTKNTITSPEKLRAELSAVRQRGYAMDNEEIECGLLCVAAPIIDINGRALAAVSIAGPSFRMRPMLQEMIAAVKTTSGNISKLMGGAR